MAPGACAPRFASVEASTLASATAAVSKVLDAPAARARAITKRYGEGDVAVDALRGVNVEFVRGSFTAIMGPSGSGKSTLLHVLAGLDQPSTGSVEIAGTSTEGLSDRELTLLRRRQIGFVFQSYNLLPVLTAEENITLPVTIGGTDPDPTWLETLLETMNLTARRDHRPGEMSGGEQQRVAVARALITKPAVVFADEPTGNLDSVSSQEILELLRRTVDDLGQTIVMVTHDPRAAAIADRVLFLADGRIVEDVGRMSVDQILERLKSLR